MKVQYYTKQVYGNTLNYLIASEASEAIYNLIAQKTISEAQMEACEKLGIEFERVFEPVS